jgi:hypothetical protein
VNTTSVTTFSASFQQGLSAARSGDRRATLQLALQQVLLGLVPVAASVGLTVIALRHHNSAVDFRDAYYVAAHRVMYGGDPYSWGHAQIADGVAFVYPALSALIYTPFALLPVQAACIVVSLICIALAPLTLWVLRVQDWRVYGVTMLWLPVWVSVQSGNETIVLVLLAALAWRYRDRPFAAGLLAAAAISLKPFMWPLALWLLATRRWHASVWTVITGLIINVTCWSVLGFSEVGAYLRDAGLDAHYASRTGYSIAAIAAHLGVSTSAGEALTVLVCVLVALAVVYVGFVKHRERQALTLTVLLMLTASPLVWTHYFALLLVPLAIERPRFSWPWVLPLLIWLCPVSYKAVAWQELLAWAAVGTMVLSLSRKALA